MSPRKLLELDEKVDDNEVQRTKTDEVKEVKTKKASKHSKKQRQASNQKLSKPLGEADLLKSSGVDIFQRSPQHKVIYPYKRQKKSKQQEPTTVLDSSSEDNSSSDDDKENVVVTPVRERNMQRRTINLEGDQLKQFKNAAERYGFLENTFPDKQEISVMSRKIALDILGLPSDTRVIISEDLEKTFTTSIRTKRSNILNYNLPKFLKKYPFDMTLIPEEYQQPRQYLYNYITETGRFTRPGLAEKNGRLRSTIFADCIAECFLTRHFSKKNYDRERTEKLTKEIVALAYAMIYFIMVKEYTEYMEEDDKGECHEKMKKIQNREFKKGSYWSKVYENAAWGCTLSDSQWQKVLEIQQAAFDRRVKSNLKVDAVEEEMNPVDDFGSLSDDDY